MSIKDQSAITNTQQEEEVAVVTTEPEKTSIRHDTATISAEEKSLTAAGGPQKRSDPFQKKIKKLHHPPIKKK